MTVIGAWGAHAAAFLTGLGLFMLVLFGLPMALWPLRWAKALRWQLPAETHLAIYFGRCLGCVVSAMALASLAAAWLPVVQPFWFAFITCNGALMIAAHAYGAVRRIQPLSETLEIFFWALLVGLTLCCWPT